jgi:transmembrane sensor
MKEKEPTVSAALAALRIEAPLRQLSRQGVDERTVRRMWEVIDQRTALAGTGRRQPRTLAIGLSAFAAVLLVVSAWFGLSSTGIGSRALATAGPLLTADGQRFEDLEASAQGASTRVTLSDGSSIEVLPGARVEGLAATSSEFVVLLRRGRARFSVTPGGPRRWLIETRGARVEVVGTVLSVESSAELVNVAVDVGVVLVRSPLLSDGVQRLGAGESLRLELHGDPDGLALSEPEALPDAAAPTAKPQPRFGAAPLRRAIRASDEDGAARGTRAAQLWAEADRARQAGEPGRAASALERLLREHPRDSQAALAAYTLGVLQLEQLERPRAAARSFEHALGLGIASGLRESCFVRLSAALRQSGDTVGLRRIAARYLRDYPGGRQRAAMQQALDEDPP